jgi:hypothetical protein
MKSLTADTLQAAFNRMAAIEVRDDDGDFHHE